MTQRSVLSAVDFSEYSQRALRWAGEFSRRADAQLFVLSVVDPLLATAAKTRLAQDLLKETEGALREFVDATWPDDQNRSGRVILKVQTGDAATIILDIAAHDQVQLLVVGTQGLAGVRKWLLGSTTERVLRQTPIPVLAVPLTSRDPRLARILAATDFSTSSVAAIKAAVQLAQQFSAELSLAHVVELLPVLPKWQSLVEESNDTRVADARVRLTALGEQLCGAHRCEIIVAAGRPAELIASLAVEQDADLIVMGLGGEQGGFARRPGSIAYRVLGSAEVPVLVVPSAPSS